MQLLVIWLLSRQFFFVLKMLSAFYVCSSSLQTRVNHWSKHNEPWSDCSLWEQSDLGPFCLQYKLPENFGRWEEQTTEVVTGGKGLAPWTSSVINQGSHRLEKYWNIQDRFKQSLKIKFASKSTWKTFKGLEMFLNFTIYRRIQHCLWRPKVV